MSERSDTFKVVIPYLRVSSKEQVEGDGFARQEDTINRWIRSQGRELVVRPTFTDEGVSGSKELMDRPGLRDLFEYVQEQLEDHPSLKDRYWAAMLVERSDRLARDLVVGEVILRELAECGVKVIAAEGDIDLTEDPEDPSRTLVRQIMAAVAQYDRNSLVLKMRRARERARARHGRCEGRKPFGHFEDERPVLWAIDELHRRGYGPGQISAILNQHNRTGRSGTDVLAPDSKYPPRSGRRWYPSTVHKIVRRGIQDGRLEGHSAFAASQRK